VIREEKTALGDDIKALFQDRPTSPSPDSSEVQIVRGWQLRQRAQELQMPLDDIKFLKEVFDSFDIDGSGTLEFEEFEATVRRLLELTGLPTDNARAMSEWSYWDSGCSQGIDFDEFLKWYSSNSFKEDFLLTRDQQELRRIAKKYKVSPDYVEEMKKHFDLCTNYAEEASLDEFRPALLKALKVPAGCKMPESRIRFFWSQLDADSSGQVNFSEFFDWWMLYFGEQEGAEQLPFERFYGQVRRLGKDFLDPPPVAEPPVAEPPVAALLPTSTDNGNVDRTGEHRQGNHSIIGDTE
jgi:Ca2+-binding EF-hand superfamily protein